MALVASEDVGNDKCFSGVFCAERSGKIVFNGSVSKTAEAVTIPP
jgi:hypothetical protein